jgi:hypothetical protein
MAESIESLESEIELSWTLLERSHWGGEYDREIKPLMLGHAFGFANRVISLCEIRKLRSQRVMGEIVRVGSGTAAAWGESFAYRTTAASSEEPQAKQGNRKSHVGWGSAQLHSNIGGHFPHSGETSNLDRQL